jgi:uncharacterized protein YbjT (DUF2867 family)
VKPDLMIATIFGATGMVGIEVLHQCLTDPGIHEVIAIGRRPSGTVHPKLREIPLTDFTEYSALEGDLAKTDIVFYCLGVYQGMVPEEQFWEITCTYPQHLIEALERVRGEVTFCLFSAQGADPSERSRFLFAKAKGRAERILTESRLAARYIFRPGFINPGRRAAKSRVPAWVAQPFYKLIPAMGIDAAALARVMVHIGLEGASESVFENRDIRRVAASLTA